MAMQHKVEGLMKPTQNYIDATKKSEQSRTQADVQVNSMSY